jgi:hypothetical protein
MAIEIISGIRNFSREALDKKAGPYGSLIEALVTVDESQRYIGLKFIVVSNAIKDSVGNYIGGEVQEYTFESGITDDKAITVEKVSSAGKALSYARLIGSSSQNLVSFDARQSSNVVVDMADNYLLEIRNYDNSSRGSILVKQTELGFRYLTMPDGGKGIFRHLIEPESGTLIHYFVVDSILHFSSEDVINPEFYGAPSTMTNAIVDYVDVEQIMFSFEAPFANVAIEPVDYYEIRIADFEIVDEATFIAARRLINLPVPGAPNERQTVVTGGLRPNTLYYVAMRSVKVNYGVPYRSEFNIEVVFRSASAVNSNKPLKIPLYENQVFDHIKGTNPGKYASNLVNLDGVQYDIEGFPSTQKTNGLSYFDIDYQTKTPLPYEIQLDMKSEFQLERLYFLRYTQSSRANISVFIKASDFDPWEEVSAIDKVNIAAWNYVTIDKKARWIKLIWDANFSMSTIPDAANYGEDRIISNNFATLWAIIPYGKLLSGSFENAKLLPPPRRSRALRTFREFLGINHIIDSPVSLMKYISGPETRMYTELHWLADENNKYVNEDGQTFPTYSPTGINDLKFTLKNSHIRNFDTLLTTITSHGHRPLMTLQGGLFWSCLPVVNPEKDPWAVLRSKVNDTRLTTGEYPLAFGDNRAYIASHSNPENYRSVAALAYEVGLRYGDTPGIATGRLMSPNRNGITQEFDTGLNIIGTVEIMNEPDRDWFGRLGHFRPEELAALISACYDGHCNTLEDEDGVKNFGLKNAAPNVRYLMSGLAYARIGYLQAMVNWWQANRVDGQVPFDGINTHHYSSNTGGQVISSKVTMGVSIEFDSYCALGDSEIATFVDWRDRYFPDKEIWLTEWGVSEHGISNVGGQRIFAPPNMGPHHKSHIRGAWIVRGLVWLKSMGIDVVNQYWFEDTGANYFNREPYLWNWGTERYYEEKADWIGSKFDTMGLISGKFNAYYPLKPAFFWTATLLHNIGDYHFVTYKSYTYNNDPIYIASFVHSEDNNRTMYVVWSATPFESTSPPDTVAYNNNFVYQNIPIDLPPGTTEVNLIETYVPTLPNPFTDPVDDVMATAYTGYKDPVTGDQMTADPTQRAIQIAAWENYLENNPEGIKGRTGVKSSLSILSDRVVLDVVDEFPKYLEIIGGRDYVQPKELTDLVARSLSETEIELQFNTKGVEDRTFDIFMSETPTNITYLKTSSPSENIVVISGLISGTQYFFKVRVKGADSNGGLSEMASAFTNVFVPVVTAFTSDNITSTTVTFSWTYPDSATLPTLQNFTLYRATSPVGFYEVVADIDKDLRQHIVNGLNPQTMYYFKIKAMGELGDSSFSGTVALTTRDITLEPPLILSSSTNDSGSGIYVNFNVTMSDGVFPQGWTIFQYDDETATTGTFYTIVNVVKVAPMRYYLEVTDGISDNANGILMSYEKLAGSEIRSDFTYELSSINDLIVQNYIGQGIGLLSKVKMSFRVDSVEKNQAGNSQVYDTPPPAGWNDINAEPNTGVIVWDLNDESGQDSGLGLYLPENSRTPGSSAWSRATAGGGLLLDFPEEVVRGTWMAATYHSNQFYSSFKITGVPTSNVTVNAILGTHMEFGPLGDPGSVLIVEVNAVAQSINARDQEVLTFTAIPVTENGEIEFIFKNVADPQKELPVNFLMLEIYDPTIV